MIGTLETYKRKTERRRFGKDNKNNLRIREVVIRRETEERRIYKF
jgi:hypothetical protein